MASKSPIRVGIIGTGGMARQHAQLFSQLPHCTVTACADIDLERAEAFAQKHGISAAYGDAETMIDTEPLEAVAVVTTDAAHAPISLAALKRGLHVLCEKPLASTLDDARKLQRAATRAGVVTSVNFSYRNRPAAQKAAELVASGKLGALRHVQGEYLQSWLTLDWQVEPSLLWRLSTRHGSAGVLGDIGVHLLDLAAFIVGDLRQVACDLPVFDKGRKRIGAYVFDANDSFAALAVFANGARGTLNATRWARGHGNTVRLRVYGDKAALDLDLDRPEAEQLKIFASPKKGAPIWDNPCWHPVKCPKTPTQHARFIQAIRKGVPPQTTFADGLKVQRYLDACFRSADQHGAWIKV